MLSIFSSLCITQVIAQIRPSDLQATRLTSNLLNNLAKLADRGYLFGHQDALAYGVNWKYEAGRSDVKDVTGDHPGLYGWEIGHIENGAPVNLDSVPFDKMKQYIKAGYERGAVITISWHGDNPLRGKSAWDPAPGTVASILPGGARHEVFVAQLDKVAAFLADLKGSKGEAIPILFRPFHELTGGWFWWGVKSSSPAEFKQLFRFSINYLRHEKQLHHLLIGYNTGTEFDDAATFLERYPGDDVVDILSFDTYARKHPDVENTFAKDLSRRLSIVESVAKVRHKVPALGEIGFSQVPHPKWWTQVLAPALAGHRFAYVLLWRNAGYKAKEKEAEYYVPYKGQLSEKDFVEFYKLPQTFFEKDAAKWKLYHD